ncbi:MAG TPA: tRNA epoxyqueuosine(34) reductase QueG [Geminicoccaceae bacterium]|nr:tRNA epoxyqueuosine(34) reductase QueG [Geminicoccaceae bacterium]
MRLVFRHRGGYLSGMATTLQRSRPALAPEALKPAIRERARALGFDVVGFAAPALPRAIQSAYRRYIAEGRQGDMAWLAREPERRESPSRLWPGARSAIALGMNYGPDADPLAALVRRDRGAISVYAQNRDYHDLIKGQLKQLAGWLHARYAAEVKVFVDTAPVLEKPLAQRAGIGWQGKHSNLVSRTFGSWLFLGEVLTDLDLKPDPPEVDYCGSCRACLDVCPTAAFPAPYQLDARRCISYLTIEHQGHIDREFRRPIGNRIYGCDDCLAVCPWNKFARTATEARLRARDDLRAPALAKLARLDGAGFRTLFAGSPIKRTGRDRFVRNVLIAIGNSGDRALAGLAEERLLDASPLVRAMAVWALSELLDRESFAALAATHRSAEPDPEVRAEWAEASA